MKVAVRRRIERQSSTRSQSRQQSRFTKRRFMRRCSSRKGRVGSATGSSSAPMILSLRRNPTGTTHRRSRSMYLCTPMEARRRTSYSNCQRSPTVLSSAYATATSILALRHSHSEHGEPSPSWTVPPIRYSPSSSGQIRKFCGNRLVNTLTK